jgi:hypothetical protein
MMFFDYSKFIKPYASSLNEATEEASKAEVEKLRAELFRKFFTLLNADLAKNTIVDYPSLISAVETMFGAKDIANDIKLAKTVEELSDISDNYLSDGLVLAENSDIDFTAKQQSSIDKLASRGFKVNKVSDTHAEEDGGPTVYMSKRSGGSSTIAEVEPNGMVNGETVEQYLQSLE